MDRLITRTSGTAGERDHYDHDAARAGLQPQGDTGMPPQPTAFAPSAYPPPRAYNPPPAYYPPPPQQDMSRRPRHVMSALRIIVGATWGVIAVICAAGAVMEWVTGIPGGAVLCLIFAVGTSWYDYRVWTFKAKRLWFIV